MCAVIPLGRSSGHDDGSAMVVVLATLGFTSIIGQVVLMRELLGVLFGNELVFGLILAWWLLWEAVGAWVLGWWAKRHNWGHRALGLTVTIAALALPLEVALARSIRQLLGVTPGAIVSLNQLFWLVGLVLALYCLAHGLGFSLGARLLGGDAAGRAYAWESVGAVVGGALFSFFLIDHLDPFQTVLLVLATSLIGVMRLRPSMRRHPLLTAAILAIGVVFSLSVGPRIHQATLKRQWPRLVFASDSRYGRLTITALGGQRAFFENGLLAFETESTFPEEVVHLPLLSHPAPQRILLIGGGVAGDLMELFKHRVSQVVYVELDPLMIQAAQIYLPEAQAAVLRDSRVELIHQDGRRYIKNVGERFDVVVLDLPEPSTGQLNRFYTLEFFQQVRAVLTDEGIFSVGLPSAENYWTRELLRRNASVYHTLRQVFPKVLVTPGDHNFFLATTDASFASAEQLGEQLRERDIATHWVTAEYIEFLLTGDRFKSVLTELEGASDVKLNRDLTPICYYYDLALWVSRFGSDLRGLFETTSLLHLGWLVLPIVVGLVVLWGRRKGISMALVGGTGFSAMTLQIVLLLAFQALHGYVYHQVGLLVTAFMAGLALGAGVVSHQRSTNSRRLLFGVQSGLVAYALGLAILLPQGPPAPGYSFPVLAGVAGALTGAVFPLVAALSNQAGTNHVAGLLYGADLLGGCCGALVTSVILVPVLGVVQTCLVVGLLSGAGMLLAFYPACTDTR